MKEKSSFTEDSTAVQAHLGIIQAVIQRMSSNSSSSKAWCVAMVSAILVLVADKDKPDYAWIAAIPTLLFLVLDAYYLALEKGFIESYNAFIDKLHQGELKPHDLYAVVPTGPKFDHFFKAIRSFSVWPIYGTLLVMIYVTWAIVI